MTPTVDLDIVVIAVRVGLGMACGAGLVELVAVALGAVLLILLGGERIESWMERRGIGNRDRP